MDPARREPNTEAFTPRTTTQEQPTMAWVEPKGAGFRVGHRYPSSTPFPPGVSRSLSEAGRVKVRIPMPTRRRKAAGTKSRLLRGQLSSCEAHGITTDRWTLTS